MHLEEEREMADIDLTAANSTTTVGGVIFQDVDNIGSGSGGYNPFLAIKDNDGNEAGFNTDTDSNEVSNPNIDNSKTSAVLLANISIIIVNGVQYYEIRFDVNESNNERLVSLNQFKLYAGPNDLDPLLGVNLVDTLTELQSLDLVYNMDAGTDRRLLLNDASTGSGTDDYSILVPVSLFAGYNPATTFMFLYAEIGTQADIYDAVGGFEEFNIQDAGTLSGTKFNDLDSDGVRDAGEGPVAGVTVFIDADQDGVLDGDTNANGVQDVGEIITERYTATDAFGNYTFNGVALGTWQIDEIVPAGSTQTTGAFETATISSLGQVVIVDPIGNHYPVPRIAIDKAFVNVTDGPDGGSASTTVINGAGDIANYTIRVTNNGETALTNVVVTDALADAGVVTAVLSGGFNAGDANSNNVLDIGETWQYTARQTATQGDIDTNGGGDSDKDNSATVVATAQGTANTVTATDTAAAPIIPAASLAITKVFDGYTGGDNDSLGDFAGDIANYTITVTNTGNQTLTGVVATDPLTGSNVPVGTLAPGQSYTFNTQYVLTQADLDGGGVAGPDHDIDNTATAVSNQTGPASASAVAPLVYDPSIAIVKSVLDVDGDGAGGSVDAAGDVIMYRVVVTNTGNVTLTNVTVVDPLTGLNITGVTLAPGASQTFDSSYTATQADIDTNGGTGDGDVDNTATADSAQTGPVSDSEDVPIIQDPSLVVDKAFINVTGGNNNGVADVAGDVINYSILVTNTGNQTLTNVIVTDPLTGLDVNVGTLAPGASATLYEHYTVTQADLDGKGGGDGDVDNTATADSDQTPPDDDSVQVPLVYTPSIAIVKSVLDVDGDGAGGSVDAAGDVIMYRVVVTNTGNVTLTNVTVVDPLTGLNITGVTLAPGASQTFDSSYTATQADIDTNGGTGDGDVDNTATADSAQTGPVSDSEDVPIIQDPSLVVDKAFINVTGGNNNGVADVAGDVINYSILVTNTGNQTLTNVIVTDPLTGLDVNVGTLAPGASATLYEHYTVTQADLDGKGGGDGDVDNTATADSDQTPPDDDSVQVPLVYAPSLNITKDASVAGGTADAAGELINYSITVANTGNTTLTGVTVTDPYADAGSIVRVADLVGDNDAVLEVGETWAYTAAHTVTQAEIDSNGGGNGLLENTATADSNETGPDSDDANVPVEPRPSLNITKDASVAGGTADAAGELINYSITVANTGNTTLTGVTVTDPYADAGSIVRVADLVGDNDAVLEVGETWAYTAAHTVTQAEIDSNGGGNGLLENTATADSNETGPDSDDANVPVEPRPSLNITKDVTSVTGGVAGAANSAGDVINYAISVQNTGNITLTGVNVTDPNANAGSLVYVSGDTNTDGELDVGETWIYSAAHTVTQAELNNRGGGDGDVDNIATADSDQTGPDTDDASAPLVYNPLVDLEKLVSIDGTNFIDADTAAAGYQNVAVQSSVFFRVTVQNTGNIDLTNVVITDVNTTAGTPGNSITLFSGGSLQLAGATMSGDTNNDGELDVGETWTINYTQGFDLGQHVNTAYVTDLQGAIDNDAAHYFGIQAGPGTRTPGFWSNLGAQFWNNVVGDETKSGPTFADGELLYKVDSNCDGVINGSDRVGLLIGDYNHNGLRDAGEDVLFINLADAKQLINASQRTVKGDGVQMLGRDVVATWLNYLAGNPIGGEADVNSPQHFINDAVDWLQTFAGVSGGTSNKTEVCDVYNPAHTAVRTNSAAWTKPQFADDPHSASQMHSALDGYNNTGDINGVTYSNSADSAFDVMLMTAANSGP